jgi:glycosyltransferase involved in cell wall biosynthesis
MPLSRRDQDTTASGIIASALLTTYNQADLVEQAIESALAQEVDGGYEILIADDYSSDGTRNIAASYRDRHPDRIRLVFSERNMGANIVRAHGTRQARGAYVALLDGDDYWTSPEKIRKQVTYLNRHPECAICFHNALVVYDDGSQEAHPFHLADPTHRLSRSIPPEISTLGDIAVGNFMQTSSVIFRRGLIEEFPDWYFKARIDDWAFHVLNAEHGDIGYIDEVLSAYRVHGGGAWSDRISHYRDPKDLEDIIWIHDAINKHLGFRFDARIKRQTAYLAARVANLLGDEGRFEEAAVHARRSLADAPNLKGVRGRLRLGILARPRLARAWEAARGARRRARRAFG